MVKLSLETWSIIFRLDAAARRDYHLPVLFMYEGVFAIGLLEPADVQHLQRVDAFEQFIGCAHAI